MRIVDSQHILAMLSGFYDFASAVICTVQERDQSPEAPNAEQTQRDIHPQYKTAFLVFISVVHIRLGDAYSQADQVV
jgi:hypothetical protein